MIEFKEDFIVEGGAEPEFEMPKERVNFIRDIGVHTVRILTIEEKGLSEKDPNWFRLDITYATPDDAQIKQWIYIPIAGTLCYGEKKSGVFSKPFLSFLRSLGVKPETMVNGSLMYKVTKALLQDPQKLTGAIMNVYVDYDDAFTKSFKLEDGTYEQRAFNKDGSPMVGVGPFKGFEEVKIYTATTGTRFSMLKVMDYRALSSCPNEQLLKQIVGISSPLCSCFEGNSPF